MLLKSTIQRRQINNNNNTQDSVKSVVLLCYSKILTLSLTLSLLLQINKHKQLSKSKLVHTFKRYNNIYSIGGSN